MTKYTQEELDAKIAEETKGLKEKNAELLASNKTLKTERDSAKKEVETLTAEKEAAESEAAAKTGSVEDVKKNLQAKFEKDLAKERETAEAAKRKLNEVLIDKGLHSALVGAKVAPQFLEAASAMILKGHKVEVSEVDGKSVALIDGKAVDSFIKEWSQGDNGKHFVAAGNNGGGHAKGGDGKGSEAKTITRAEFSQLSPNDQAAKMKEGLKVTD